MPNADKIEQLKIVGHFSPDDPVETLQALTFSAEPKASKHGSWRLTAPLHWWYRAHRGEHLGKWERVPAEALQEMVQNNRVVRVGLDRLPREDGFRRVYFINVTEAGNEPSDDGCEVMVPDLPPRLPFPVAGRGSGGHGEDPRPVAVTMSRTRVPNTEDEILWVVIRNSAKSLGFDDYQAFMDGLFVNPNLGQVAGLEKRALVDALKMPLDLFAFSSIDAYRVLKVATELFVTTNCGVVRTSPLATKAFVEEGRFSHSLTGEFNDLWREYLTPAGRVEGGRGYVLPYLDLIRRKLGGIGSARTGAASLVERQAGLLQEKLLHPCLLELIWSYWIEEGMLVQAFNSITRRFQNHRASGDRDPLAQLEIDPLRPLNNVLWGWIQDEQSQLSVLRRAHEYDHQYGFTLHGKALAELRTADRRSKFLESFHNLLWKCMQFYRQDDDTTVIADGFAILNALKETHYLLAQGAHNQFGNLPSTARQEMLMQQWILSRPEMREFLGGRIMVPYPEAWMDRVDNVKTLKGWTDTSVVHFRDLAVFGEQILLSVRWGAWSTVDDPNSAANWARYWRAEVQGYIHAYRAATSVDLTTDITDQRQADSRFLAPSVHLRNRLMNQASR
jgi:hypothetical protein